MSIVDRHRLHLYLPTRDFERAVEFYGHDPGPLPCSCSLRQAAGRRVRDRQPSPCRIAVEEFGITFHVNENEIALHVEDIEAARAEFKVTRRRVQSPTRCGHSVCHMAFFRRPGRHALMLHHR